MERSATQLDEIDRKILRALQSDSQRPRSQIAQEVGLSQTPCLRRIKLLEEAGYIVGYQAKLSRKALGYGLLLFVRVTLDRQDESAIKTFADRVTAIHEVLECHLMAGSYDYLLRIIARDLDDYHRFQMDVLTPLRGVRNIQTEIPLKSLKDSAGIPI